MAGDLIPLYAMLDVWTALYGTSHPEFDEFYAEHGYSETWARLLAEIRKRQTSEGPAQFGGINLSSWPFTGDE